MDLVALSLAKKSAKTYTDGIIENLPRGIVFKGSVNYYNNLPNNAEIGDCYIVKYTGSSGSTPDGSEYVWGTNTATSTQEWIAFSTGDLSNYYTKSETDNLLNTKNPVIDSSHKLSSDLVDDTNNTNKFVTASDKSNWNAKVGTTDYASASTGGVFKTGNGTNVGSTGYITASAYSYADYQTKANNVFIGKGTLENVITGKQLVSENNIKTINNQSIIGSGNIDIGGGSTYSAGSGISISNNEISVDTSIIQTTSNKVTSLSSDSTDNQYPSAKCVYDLIGDINSVLSLLTTPSNGGN